MQICKKTKGKKIAFHEILLTLRRNVLIETLQKCKINGKEYEKRRRSTKTWRFGITYQFQDISKAFRKFRNIINLIFNMKQNKFRLEFKV